MTVAELVEMLEDFDPDSRVLVATQPSWPLQFELSDVVDDGETFGDGDAPTVYLTTGAHPDDSPYAPHAVFGV